MSFMNRSGHPLFAIAQFYKIDPAEILVVLDDLALPLGRLRLRADGGSGGHNGLESTRPATAGSIMCSAGFLKRKSRSLDRQSITPRKQ